MCKLTGRQLIQSQVLAYSSPETYDHVHVITRSRKKMIAYRSDRLALVILKHVPACYGQGNNFQDKLVYLTTLKHLYG